MEPEFWMTRWARNEIGFHLPDVNPELRQHWPALVLPPGCTVLVPLAGKTVDLRWLREQGHRVVAVELSEAAALAFYAEAGLSPQRREGPAFIHFSANDIEYLVGDFFALDAATVGSFAGVWDRGALVALPPALRQRYVAHLAALSPPGCRTLLITLEYAQAQMNGPPFAVMASEVEALFGATHALALLAREDILEQEPRFKARGVTALASCAWKLQANT